MQYIIIADSDTDDGDRIGCTHGESLGEFYGKTFDSREEAERVAAKLRDDLPASGLDQSIEYHVVAAEPTHTRQLANPFRRPRQQRLPGQQIPGPDRPNIRPATDDK